MAKEQKKRHTLWLTDSAWGEVENLYQKINCSTKNEFVERAIRFYSGYLTTEKAGEYLPAVLSNVLDGKLDALGKRMSRLMFKQAVEQDMMSNLLA